MKSVMLYFGSFNPIHKGHMSVAEYVLAEGVCDEVWFVVSPHNPLKPKDMLIAEQDRLRMAEIAVASSDYSARMRVCDVEFSLPKPSYTISTLEALSSSYPNVVFSLLVGTDIVPQFEKWRDWQKIIDNYRIYVYPREGYGDAADSRFSMLSDAPYHNVSSTEIRDALAGNGKATDALPAGVYEYIKANKLWI